MLVCCFDDPKPKSCTIEFITLTREELRDVGETRIEISNSNSYCHERERGIINREIHDYLSPCSMSARSIEIFSFGLIFFSLLRYPRIVFFQ